VRIGGARKGRGDKFGPKPKFNFKNSVGRSIVVSSQKRLRAPRLISTARKIDGDQTGAKPGELRHRTYFVVGHKEWVRNLTKKGERRREERLGRKKGKDNRVVGRGEGKEEEGRSSR